MNAFPDLPVAAARTADLDRSLALTVPLPASTPVARVGTAMLGGALAVAVLALAGLRLPGVGTLALGLGLLIAGALLRIVGAGGHDDGAGNAAGTWHRPAQRRGVGAWLLAAGLTAYYAATYWHPGLLDGLVRAFDPLAHVLRGRDADVWFVYSTLYSLAVGLMAVRSVRRWRRPYHAARTASVTFFQVVLAWALPSLLVRLGQPELYLHYTWPLDYDGWWPATVGTLTGQGGLGWAVLLWSVLLLLVATPVLTYLYGKRWYCAWVCGCGGLAETAGDPYRHLADTSVRAWQVERWMVHGVLALIVVATGLLWLHAATGWLGGAGDALARGYGFWIGAVFSGVVGVGFYPLMGARVWCRFGCPMAAILGLQQRFASRFRIATNGGACIACGQCSTHCEMGIDVRHYAMRGQNVVRAGCVGCGVCATVCPRGVLRLENGPDAGATRTATVFVPEADVLVMEG